MIPKQENNSEDGSRPAMQQTQALPGELNRLLQTGVIINVSVQSKKQSSQFVFLENPTSKV